MAKKEKRKRESPTSNFFPLDFDDAVAGLLAVDPAKVAKPNVAKKSKKKVAQRKK